MYEQSWTENEKDKCLKPNVLYWLQTKNFNEVVRLHMKPKNKQFVTNGKILHSLEGKIAKFSREEFSDIFVEQLLCLLDKVEGTFLYPKDSESFGIWLSQRVSINIGAPGVEPGSVELTPNQFRSMFSYHQGRNLHRKVGGSGIL